MVFRIRFDQAKNELLRATRGICFDDVQTALEQNEGVLDDFANQNPRYGHQRVLVIKLHNYAYAVRYVINEAKHELFLKTIYPSRVFTKIYLGERKHEKTRY